MKLVYKDTQEPVQVGDKIPFNGHEATVAYFVPPHKPSSSGKVTLDLEGTQLEYFVGVIDAEWIEREDQLAAHAIDQARYGGDA